MKIDPTGAVTFEGLKDLPMVAESVANMTFNRTGSWKYAEPFYRGGTPPCNHLCLTAQDIVRQLALVAEGRFAEALALLREANPFPAIVGRVCPHPCEKDCNRRPLGGVVAVSRIERFLGDWGIEHEVRYAPEAKRPERVAVVGSGPAGLSCAFYLARRGHPVTVYEALDVIGGMLRTGIPSYRLPRNVLDRELEIFNGLPVTFECGRRLGKNLSIGDLTRFSAAFIGVGRYSGRPLGCEGDGHPGVVQGINLLRDALTGVKMDIPERVAVVGGGNTALDCVRVLMRLGKKPVLVYRRTEEEMPAFETDKEEAREEGVEMVFQAAPMRVKTSKSGVVALECVKTRPGKEDASGRREPMPIEGSLFSIKCGMVVKALGETPDLAGIEGEVELSRSRGIGIGDDFATSVPGVFAGGDCAGGQGTVGDAIWAGRRAANAMAAYIEKRVPTRIFRNAGRLTDPAVVESRSINRAYLRTKVALPRLSREGSVRTSDFEEVNQGFDEATVRAESARCISCGTCTLCDNCRLFCPDVAIRFLNGRTGYSIDYDHCKGCGICVEECPRGVMAMREVQGK